MNLPSFGPETTQYLNSELAFDDIIELKLFYWGSLSREDICKHFNLGKVKASAALKSYAELHPRNMVYSTSDRAYIWTHEFHASTATPAEIALELLASGIFPIKYQGPVFSPEAIGLALNLSPELVGPMTRAMVLGNGINIDYVSGTSGASHKTLYPHSIFKSGGAWYFRAYDAGNRQFRTFRFNRISRCEQTTAPEMTDAASSRHDTEWQTPTVLSLGPHPKHPHPEALALDLGLAENSVRNIVTNQIMAPFILTDLRVDCSKDTSLDPYEYPIHLMNRNEVDHLDGMVISPGFNRK